jgi:hypothetical protein
MIVFPTFFCQTNLLLSCRIICIFDLFIYRGQAELKGQKMINKKLEI